MLIDDILNRKRILDSPTYESVISKSIPFLHLADVIKANNVAEYLHYDNSQEIWDIGKDFPCSLPPFPITWIEWINPTMSNNGGVLAPFGDGNTRIGVLCQTIDLRKEEKGGEKGGEKESGGAVLLSTPQAIKNSSARYLIRVNVFYCKPEDSDRILPMPMQIQYLADENGALSQTDSKTGLDEYSLATVVFDKTIRSLPHGISAILFVPFLTMSFCQCRNVRKVPNLPPEKLNKSRERKSKFPLHKYYTLDIQPMKQTLIHEGKSKEQGLLKAMHICKGHFRDYREGAGLFGKIHGKFWVPKFERGSKEVGEIHKDYEVKIEVNKGLVP